MLVQFSQCVSVCLSVRHRERWSTSTDLGQHFVTSNSNVIVDEKIRHLSTTQTLLVSQSNRSVTRSQDS